MNYEDFDNIFTYKFNTNNKVEKINYKNYLYKQVGLCTICSYHNGCISNERGKYKDRNWKKYRKNQYKEN